MESWDCWNLVFVPPVDTHPLDISQEPSPNPHPSPVGTGKRGGGWWPWAPPLSGLAELSAGPGGTLTHPLWLFSCGEPDAADSWKAGLPGTQFCLRRGVGSF